MYLPSFMQIGDMGGGHSVQVNAIDDQLTMMITVMMMITMTMMMTLITVMLMLTIISVVINNERR